MINVMLHKPWFILCFINHDPFYAFFKSQIQYAVSCFPSMIAVKLNQGSQSMTFNILLWHKVNVRDQDIAIILLALILCSITYMWSYFWWNAKGYFCRISSSTLIWLHLLNVSFHSIGQDLTMISCYVWIYWMLKSVPGQEDSELTKLIHSTSTSGIRDI